jgi:nitrogen regulatory protein PII
MQLFVHITNHEESVAPIFSKLMEAGFQGASVVDCQGMLTTLSECNSDDAPPIFGSLRQFINPCRQANKMIMIVLKDEDVATVKEIVHGVAGDLKGPNSGILFTVPVMNWEGVSHK